MYNDKEVAALIKAYNDRGQDMTPEEFVRSVDKEEGWSYDDKQPAMFKDIDGEENDGYLVKLGFMMPVMADSIGVGASTHEVKQQFKKDFPWIDIVIDGDDEKLFVLKEGDMFNKAYTGDGEVSEKPPKHRDTKVRGENREEVDRFEVLAKKIRFEDGTWTTAVYDVNNGILSKDFDRDNCLDALVSGVMSIIRASGDEQGRYMQETMDALNDLFLDADTGTVDSKNLEKD